MINVVKNFMPFKQIVQLSLSIEGDEILKKVHERIVKMPTVLDDEEEQTKFHLHYQYNDSHLYIACKDHTDEQIQAFGYAVLNGDYQMSEYGYIPICDYIKLGFVLDINFVPINAEKLIESFEV